MYKAKMLKQQISLSTQQNKPLKRKLAKGQSQHDTNKDRKYRRAKTVAR